MLACSGCSRIYLNIGMAVSQDEAPFFSGLLHCHLFDFCELWCQSISLLGVVREIAAANCALASFCLTCATAEYCGHCCTMRPTNGADISMLSVNCLLAAWLG